MNNKTQYTYKMHLIFAQQRSMGTSRLLNGWRTSESSSSSSSSVVVSPARFRRLLRRFRLRRFSTKPFLSLRRFFFVSSTSLSSPNSSKRFHKLSFHKAKAKCRVYILFLQVNPNSISKIQGKYFDVRFNS